MVEKEERLKELIEKYRYDENIEIECRLGVIDQKTGHFVAGIPKETWIEIVKTLNSFTGWSKIEKQTLRKTGYYKNSIRSYSNFESKNKYQKIEVLEKLDFIYLERSIALRFSFKREIPIPAPVEQEEPELVRAIHRGTFYYKNSFEYCISKCAEGKNFEDLSKKENTFEIEIEINQKYLKDSNISSEKITKSFLGKSLDLLGRYNSLGVEQPFCFYLQNQ